MQKALGVQMLREDLVELPNQVQILRLLKHHGGRRNAASAK
jgi:hypothetical protein